MSRVMADALLYYNHNVSSMIAEKYGMSMMDALRAFTESETHSLLEERENGLNSMGAPAIFDIWEAEMVTGDPRRSVYIRED